MRNLTTLVSIPLLTLSSISHSAEPPSNLTQLSALETAKLICERKVTSETVVKHWLARAQNMDEFNAFSSLIDEDKALVLAKAEDERLESGGHCLPLGGVPLAVKDNIEVKGLPNSGGTPALTDFIPSVNAPVIDKLEAAGAIIIGKTGMHELAFGTSGYNTSYQGPHGLGVRNSFDPDRIPGGSSSGSAAALGARLITAALGTDTGGSTRQPCALNSCVGFRPTVGRYSGEGVIPISYSRDTVGPMANSVDDIILIDSVITGSKAVMPPQAGTIRLGVPAFFWSDLHPDVKSSAESALDRLRAAGVTLIPVEMDGIEALTGAVATAVAIYEAKPALTDYLASRGTGKTLDEVVAQISSPDVRGTFSAMVVPGMVPSADGMVPVAPLYEKAQSEGLAALSALYEKTFTDHKLDALVFPTTPEVARFSNEEASAGPTFLRTIRNTDPGSNVRMPGLSLPIGLGPQTNLPVGVEIDGLPGSDAKLLAIGKTLESIWGPGPQPNNLK